MKRFVAMLLILCACAVVVHAKQVHIPLQSQSVVKEQDDSSALSVILVNNRIRVTNAPVGSKLEVYSVVGIKVAEIRLRQSFGEYSLNIAKGYYIVRIGESVFKIAMR
jgi:hypothetical protein